MNVQRISLSLASLSLIALSMRIATVSAAPLAELVQYPATDGVGLNGLLYQPARPARTAVVLVPHGTGGYTDAFHNYTPLAEQLTAAGYAFMLTNMRTHGSNGWMYETFETSLPDVEGSVAYAKSRGYRNIVLVGVSAGGPRQVYYWTQTKDPAVKAMVYLASITSPYLEGRYRLSAGQQAAFDAFLDKARGLVRAGRGYEALCFDYFGAARECTPGQGNTLSARSFISYFGTPEESNCTSIKFNPQVTIPTAVIHSRGDELSFTAVAEEIYQSLQSAPRRDLIWLDDVGHYLRGADAGVYSAAVVKWVRDVVPAD